MGAAKWQTPVTKDIGVPVWSSEEYIPISIPNQLRIGGTHFGLGVHQIQLYGFMLMFEIWDYL